MKYALAIAALLTSAPAMAQVALTPQGDPNGPRWYADHAAQSRYEMAQNQSQMGNRGNRAPPIPAELLVIPQAWSTDQGDPEIACYHYDNGPYRDRLIEWCLAKVRAAK